MGKISNAIMMLEYLSTGKKYSVKELSEKLNVTERMIRYYKMELEKAGIQVESFMGPNGGYFLLNNRNSYFAFNKYDIQLLNNVKKKLEECNFEYLLKYEDLLAKVKKTYTISEEKAKFDVNIDQDTHYILINCLKNYMEKQERIKILYQGVDGCWTERYIHPLQLFSYKGEVYITAFCELRNDIRHFEIKRMKLE